MRTSILSLSLFALLLFAPAAWAEDPNCLDPRDIDTTGQRWTKNTNVRVWIAPSVLPDLHGPILDAVHTWGNHPKNTVNVVFTIVDAEPVDGGNTLIFRQGPVDYSRPAHYSMDPVTKRATIVLNSGITVPAAAGQTALHEMGHTYGLLDCWNCATGTSVMVERPADLNDTTWPNSPSNCDVIGAMVAMGVEKKVQSTRLPSHQKDNEMAQPECYDATVTIYLCDDGYCWVAVPEYETVICEMVDPE